MSKHIKRALIIALPIVGLILVLLYQFYKKLDVGQKARQADVIAVLTGGTEERQRTAVKLLKEGYSKSGKLIVTAYPAEDNAWTTSYYNKLGVEADQLILDNEATSTRTNASSVARIMKQRGWKTVTVVTSDYHTRRAAWCFEKEFDGTDLEFWMVSAYPKDDGDALSYEEHKGNYKMALKELPKSIGYALGLYHFIDL